MRALLLVMLCLIVTPAHADDTVRDLLQRCESQLPTEQALCVGYIAGIGAVTQTNGTMYQRGGPQVKDALKWISTCDNGPSGAMRQAFVNWAHANPERWELPASAGVMFALWQVWPCQNNAL